MTAAHGNHCCLSRIDRTATQINTQNQKKENSRTHSRKSSSDTAGTAYIKICTDGTGRKVQVDVKEVPYNCLRGKVLRDNKHLIPVDGNRRMYPNEVCIRL